MNVNICLHIILYLIGMGALLALGIVMGMSFLCIKLTLYYMPFYLAGYLYGQLENSLSKIKFFDNAKDAFVAICFVLWIFLMTRFNFFEINDGIFGVALRAVASMTGCIAICGLISGCFADFNGTNSKVGVFLRSVGVHSLEVYLIHYLTLSMVRLDTAPEFISVEGILLVILNYVLTVSVTYVIYSIINKNKILNICLFGRTK